MKSLPKISIIIVFSLVFSISNSYATRYYVDSSSDGTDGLDWTTAFSTIQSAINVATSGDEIWVKAGTYYADASDRSVSIAIPSGVMLYGGFSGSETTLDERELSDLDGNGIVEGWEFTNQTIVDGEIQNDGDNTNNTQHIITIASGVASATLLDGFTIQNGYSDAYSSAAGAVLGAGIFAQGGEVSDCQVLNCICYSASYAVYGGGIYASDATIENVLMEDCSVTGTVAAGGGAFLDGVVMTGSTISRCNGITSGTRGFGGGVYALNFSHLMNCKISDCSIGGTYTTAGGGGVYLISGSTALNTIVYNCQAEQYGGGVYCLSSYFINGVIANNKTTSTSTGTGGGAYGNGEAVFYNSVFWGNLCSVSSGADQLNNPTGITVEYCAFEGSEQGNNGIAISSDNSGTTDGVNYAVFNNPTSFVGLSGGDSDKKSGILLADWSIGLTSSLIEAGSTLGIDEASVGVDLNGVNAKGDLASDFTDMAGENRLFNYTPDIGAYEIIFLDWTLPADPETVVYGTTLGDILLSGGSVTDLRTSTAVTGAYSFVDTDFMPPYSDESVNYQVVFTPDADFIDEIALFYDSVKVDVSKKELTLSGVTAEDKEYDGTTSVNFTEGTISLVGLVTGDVVSYSGALSSAAFEDKNVGVDKNIVFTGLDLTGEDAANYTLTKLEATASITAKPVTITITAVDDKEYDGTTTATYILGDINGVISGDDVSIDESNALATFADANVGINIAVSFDGFALTGEDADNYDLSQPSDMAASITAIEVTISGITAEDKEYDGTAVATISGTAALSSNFADQGVIIDASGASAVFDDASVGADKTVTFSGYALTGSASGNYTLIQPSSTTASITQKALSIQNITIEDKYYDGTNSAVISGTATLSDGVVGSEDVSLDETDITATFSDANAGENKTVTVAGYSISGADVDNYILEEDSYTATINQVAITVEADDASKNYGESDPDLSYTVTSGSLVSGESFTGSITRDTGDDAGTYAITQGSLALSDNYTLTFTDGTFTIYQASNTISFTLESPITYEEGLTIDLSEYASATSGEYVIFAISDEDISTLSGTILSINTYGSVDITASESTNGNYVAATPVTITLTVYPNVEVVQKGSNMLLIDNSEGLFFSASDAEYIAGEAYQWYQNGNIITGATKQYYYNESGLSGTYYCIVQTRDGYFYESNSVTAASTQSMSVYPAPVSVGEGFTIDLSGFDEEDMTGVVLKVYSVTGMVIKQLDNVTETQIMSIQQPGIYIIKAEGTTNLSKRVIVK